MWSVSLGRQANEKVFGSSIDMIYRIFLTICYVDSLATAGYGTALGVIRALYAEGVLERAYCTETRPFNQVFSFHSFLVSNNLLILIYHIYMTTIVEQITVTFVDR